MTSTYSDRLRIELMGAGDQSETWGDTANIQLGTILEESIAGVATITFSGDSNYTLTTANGTTDEARQMILEIADGTITTSRSIFVPAKEKLYFVNNKNTYAVTLKVSGQSGVQIPAGKRTVVYCDGTDVVEGPNNFTTLSVANVPVVTASSTTTFTNKTIDCEATGNAITNVTASELGVTAGTASASKALVVDGSYDIDLVSGDIITGGNITIGAYMYHDADTDTYIQFTPDNIWFVTGGGTRLRIQDTGLQLGAAGATVTTIYDTDAMTENSATALATQQSIKAFVTSGTVTMTNKTLTSPVINGGTIGVSTAITNFVCDSIQINGAVISTTPTDQDMHLTANGDGMLRSNSGTYSNVKVLTSGTTITPNMPDADVFVLTLDHNATLANPSNSKQGQSGSIVIAQGSTGGTMGYGSQWKFPNGGAPPVLSTATGAVDCLHFVTQSSGNLLCALTKDHS